MPTQKPPTERRRLLRITAALLLTAGLLAACGGSGDATQASPEGSDPTDSVDGGEMISIDHEWGVTDIDTIPERIVSLDTQFTDVLLAFGVTPVAQLDMEQLIPGGIFPWQDGLEDTDMIRSDGMSYANEDVFNTEPDLILGTWAIEDQQRYDDLSDIAPTIGSPDPDREVQHWEDLVTVVGTVLHREDEAREIIDDLHADLARRAEDLPGLDGKTYTFVNYVPGDALYIVADPTDGASEAFAELGLTINPTALEAADGATGRAKFSLEQVDLLDADVILILANGGDPNDLIGFDTLRAARTDAVLSMDVGTAVALNQPSPLSLTWVLDEITPTLEAAAS